MIVNTRAHTISFKIGDISIANVFSNDLIQGDSLFGRVEVKHQYDDEVTQIKLLE